MNRVCGFQARDTGIIHSTTRFMLDSDTVVGARDKQRFELRSSHRRSSFTGGREIAPELSHGHSRDADRTIKFEVEKDGKMGKTPKQTLNSICPRSNRISLLDVKKSLELKSQSMIATGIPSLTAAIDQVTRFTGDLSVEGSSGYTDTGIEITLSEIRGLLSTPGTSCHVTCGDCSALNTEGIWPWPWLSPSLNSSKYISSSAEPTTFKFQENLQVYPFLPICDTAHTFIRNVRLFIRPEQFIRVDALLKDFSKRRGHCMQDRIIKEYSNTSFTEDVEMYWLPRLVPSVTKCLTRLEAPLANTAILTPAMWDLWSAKNGSQIDRAVILIQLCAEFARLIYSERLNVFDDESGHVQCMHQFRKIFSSSKIPGIPTDGIHCLFKTMFQAFHRKAPRHIIVICRGQMYYLEIIVDQFNTLSAAELNSNLFTIIKTAEANASIKTPSVGLLTSIDRDLWSETRLHLMELSENNRECLQKLEEAMFVLTLDHVNARGPDRLINEALFADGCNRWYDKGLSFYMYQNGLLTVNVCSSIVDNTIVNELLRFIHIRILEDAEKWDDEAYLKSGLVSRDVSEEVLDRTRTLSQLSLLSLVQEHPSDTSFDSSSSSSGVGVSALIFDTDDAIYNSCLDAKNSFTHLSENLSSAMCQFDGFDIDFLEKQKISIDAFAHLAMQLTFYNMYFRPPAAGSKVSIRRFYHARCDTMITTTDESLAWCRAMRNEGSSFEERKKLFFAAVARHVQRLEEVRDGHGCFHRLSALREIAASSRDLESVEMLDDLFELPAGSAESLDISCEGWDSQGCLSLCVVFPPSISSYGVGYAMAKARALFTVCSWKKNPGTCAENFSHSLHLCLKQLQDFVHLM